MKFRNWVTPLVLLPIACGSTPPPEPVAPEPEPAPIVEPPPEPPPPPEPTAEEKAKAAEAEKLVKDFAKMEAEASEEEKRWTDEMRAEAKKLAEGKYYSVGAAMAKVLKGTHRAPDSMARDPQRHPTKTLEFFGLKPTMTVLEYGPGEGWYTELLAPTLASKGKLLVTSGDPKGPRTSRGTLYAQRTDRFLKKAPELYGKVEVVVTDSKAPNLNLDGTLDMAIVIRGMHGWVRDDTSKAWLETIHKALKKGGVLGIVQHRALADADPKVSTKKGYLPEKFVIELIEANGFKLSKKSEINANKKDTTDHPEGVWSLPPTLREGDKDKDKYMEIGESDRMTLRFVKQ